MNENVKRIADLSPEKLELLMQMLTGEETKTTRSAPGIPRIVPNSADRYRPFPLTEIQEAYWIGRTGAIELGNVGSHRYTELERTALDLDRFTLAWQRLIDRHDMLRAIVLATGQQQILEKVPDYKI